MEQHTQPTFGKHIPPYLQDELMKARQAKQDKPQDTEPPPVEPQAEEPNQPTEPPAVETPAEPQPADVPPVPHSDDDNDVKAWKGRLKKEQAERQQLNARLIEEAEARERLEARICELEQQAQQPQQPIAQPPSDPPSGLSDTDLDELKLLSPELYMKLNALNKPRTPPPTATAPQTPPLTAPTQPAQPTVSERDRIWYAEINREIPEIQGLLGNPTFIEFAQSKTDWTGATGLDLIQQAGAQKDVRRIPAIRNLLDEYQQSQTATPATVTVPPTKHAPAKAKVSTPKQMTEKDEAHAEMLARAGKTTELKQFLAQFKQ